MQDEILMSDIYNGNEMKEPFGSINSQPLLKTEQAPTRDRVLRILDRLKGEVSWETKKSRDYDSEGDREEEG